MPVERLNIESFIAQSSGYPVLDVRSPGEYAHAHIPGAISLPLFTNEERAIIGTAYKQKGRVVAVNEGLRFFASTMKIISADALKIFEKCGKAGNPVFFVHCWRGGMRSDAVAWLLNLYGYKVYLLKGGYKAYRRWAISQFEQKRKFKILGGFTGSGKTELLHALNEQGEQIIDLELLAHHKGSSFGALGMPAQPAQEMFENELAWELGKAGNAASAIWMEDESRHIGNVHIPDTLWNQMRLSEIYFLDIPAEERLNYITAYYGKFDADALKAGVLRIQKRLGGLETKKAIHHLENGNKKECFEILLRYYDKLYNHSLEKHLEAGCRLHKITCSCVDTYNIQSILAF